MIAAGEKRDRGVGEVAGTDERGARGKDGADAGRTVPVLTDHEVPPKRPKPVIGLMASNAAVDWRNEQEEVLRRAIVARRSWSEWQPQCESAALFDRLGGDRASCASGEALRQGESESGAVVALRGAAACSRLEDLVVLVASNARPVVGDGNRGDCVVACDRDVDPRSAIASCVVKEWLQHSLDKLPVYGNADGFVWQRHSNVDRGTVLPRRADYGSDNRAYVSRRPGQARFLLCGGDERLDRAGHRLRAALDRRQRPSVLVSGPLATQHQLCLAADACERGAQLV